MLLKTENGSWSPKLKHSLFPITSYERFLSGDDNTEYASLISLNFSSAPGSLHRSG